MGRAHRNTMRTCSSSEPVAAPTFGPKRAPRREKTDRTAMQRLLTVTGTAALIVAAIVFNAVRYPGVSEQLWRASQAAHGPATEPTTASAENTISGGSRLFGRGETGGTQAAEQRPAASPPESAVVATPDRAGEFAGNAPAPSGAKPLSSGEGRFMPEAAGAQRAALPTGAERAVWPTWRSEETAPPRADSPPTPPQPFGLTPRPGTANAGESSQPNPSRAAAEASGVSNIPWPATASPAATAASATGPTSNQAPTPGDAGDPPKPNTMPRTIAAPLPATNPADLAPIAGPAPSSGRTAERTAEPTTAPRPGPAPSQTASWSPGAPGPASGRPSAISSPSPAGSLPSAVMPPPAPIPDHHRADLVPVQRPKPAADATEAGGTGPKAPWRRLPPVDEGPMATINPPTPAELPAYPSTRTP